MAAGLGAVRQIEVLNAKESAVLTVTYLPENIADEGNKTSDSNRQDNIGNDGSSQTDGESNTNIITGGEAVQGGNETVQTNSRTVQENDDESADPETGNNKETGRVPCGRNRCRPL